MTPRHIDYDSRYRLVDDNGELYYIPSDSLEDWLEWQLEVEIDTLEYNEPPKWARRVDINLTFLDPRDDD